MNELRNALRFWIKSVQSVVFAEELNAIREKDDLFSKSKLSSLHPFVDGNGLLRVGGRLEAANIPYNQQHPIILPRKHRLTELIINQTHLENLHAGPNLLLSVLRRSVRTLHNNSWVSYHYPAWNRRVPLRSGVDYAGPITLRLGRGRGRSTVKAYIALFVCMVTKAIHLELVSELSSAAFIAAFRRFTARRGRCNELFSDCGTNFVGANKELRDLHQLAMSSAHNNLVGQLLAKDGTMWNFNAPGAPHFGGLWEAGVKSIKQHLRRIVGNSILTFEEMSTVLAQIEACLNSRPLCQMSSSTDDFNALTPGHFLIGEALTAVPDPDLTKLNINRLDRWQLLQRLSQQFWNRWSRDYLSNLLQRPKWTIQKKNIQTGDLVLIKDERLPPLKWNLGRIEETHPGHDGIVRVVTVKTAGGLLKRPIVKICVLPIHD